MTQASRLESVRQAMAQLGLDAFIVQRTDQHNGEYLPASEERVAWLTGFTGSNALVAIMADCAAVFSDGRYTVQLAEEVDDELFERLHIIKEPLSAWLTTKLKSGDRLGLDPYLTKSRERDSYGRVAETVGAELVLLEANPLDEVWNQKNRPAPPCAQLKLLDVGFSGEATANKCRRIGEKIKNSGAGQLLVTAADEIAWLLNIRGADIPFNPLCLSHLLLSHEGDVRWFVDRQKLPNDLDLGASIEIADPSELMLSLDNLGEQAASVMIDPASVHLAFSARLENAGAQLVAQASPISLAKACKNAVELAGARAAQARDALAMARFLYWLDQIPLDGSITELSAAEKLMAERSKQEHYQGPSFDTISAHGPNAALPHYRVSERSNRPLTADTLYLVDSGGQYLDGTTDITRTIVLGTPSQEMCERFTLVLRGHIALARAIFPKGTHGGQLDLLARQPLWNAGLDFDHGTGHGIGAYLCVHEGPQRIAKAGGGAELKPGMIISNEPGYYKVDHYGIRIENLVIVEERSLDLADAAPMLGFETITWAPIDRRLIVPDMLQADELEWLNDYHAQTAQELTSHLPAEVAEWLRRVCAPISVAS